VTRRQALVAGGSGALAAAGSFAWSDAHAAPSPARTRDALTFLLAVQRVEADFYASAVRAGALRGKLAAFAAAAADHERRHAAFLERALGGAAPDAEPSDLAGDLVRQPGRFALTAVRLEDLVVGAFNGQAANLGPRALAKVATVAPVDARHAAWIREIVGMPPAPATADGALTARAVLDGLRREGLLG
jgi:Ferritin-like domain